MGYTFGKTLRPVPVAIAGRATRSSQREVLRMLQRRSLADSVAMRVFYVVQGSLALLALVSLMR